MKGIPSTHQENQGFVTMLNQEKVDDLNSWFEQYVHSFHTDNPDIQRNFDLKLVHTRQVCMEILDLGQSLGLNQKDLYIAEIIALFHDVGRFEQYDRYGTFYDLKSEDHAALGVRVLKENHVLDSLDSTTRDLILKSISYHNRAFLPEKEIEVYLFFSRLLRDADKLDIWRVVTDYYQNQGQERNSALELGLRNDPEIADEVCEYLLAGKIVNVAAIKTLNDFKLLQMGWVYDLNFPRTFDLVRERCYLETIVSSLPKTEKVLKVYSVIRSFLERQCPRI